MKLKGQRFGNRIIIRDYCVDDDWLNVGLKIPKAKEKYILTKCLNCGAILPGLPKNIRNKPPKRCVFCSNIGNFSSVKTLTNSWTVYQEYAVCNILYHNQVISTYLDACDYDTASKYSWRISKKRQKYYVVSGSFKKGTMVYLHQIIYGTHSDRMEIDHIDGNSLNNRRNNLRLVTRQENIDNQRATRIDNSIGIRGVSYNRPNKNYKVDFNYHGQRYYTHSWNSVEEAVWCRFCFEDYFGIEALKNNPLALEYVLLDDPKKKIIQDYVHETILRNERYNKFTHLLAATKKSESKNLIKDAGGMSIQKKV